MNRAVRASALTALLIALPATPVAAADPSDVHVGPADALLSGIEYIDAAGTWYQSSQLVDGELQTVLTLQLPAVGRGLGEPGPVVAFWQLLITVFDDLYGDSSTRKGGAVQVATTVPTCDPQGNCAARFSFDLTVAPALDAIDLPGVLRESVLMGLGVTAVRTFDDGAVLQAVRPFSAVDGDGGTPDTPSEMFGPLRLAPPIPAGDTRPALVPADQFWLSSQEQTYDWGLAVAEELARFSPPASSEPVPINVWVPERPDALRVRVRIEFTDACPAARSIVFRDGITQQVGAYVIVGGGRAYGDVTLSLDRAWSISLETQSGQVLNATSLQELGDDTGLVISGPMRCSNGKGVFTQEGIPQIVPNPNSQSPSPPAGAGSQSAANPNGILIGVLVLLAVSLVGGAGLLLAKRLLLAR